MATESMAVGAVDRPVLRAANPPLKLDITRATVPEALALGPHLRDIDKREIYAVTGRLPASGLVESLLCSRRAYSYRLDGELVAMVGVAEMTETVASPWCVIADLGHLGSLQKSRLLLREGRRMLQNLCIDFPYPVFWNMVHRRNRSAQTWLTHLGFSLRFDQETIMRGEPMIHFYLRNPTCAE